MLFNKMRAVLAELVTLAVAVIASDSSVYIFSVYPDRRTTSSTLRWLGQGGGDRPAAAVVATYEIVSEEAEQGTDGVTEHAVGQRPVHVCRARHDDVWVSGLLRATSTQCQVSFLGRVYSYSQYEVLENVETSARLSWVQWGRHSPVLPKGAVAGGESYVARRRVEAASTWSPHWTPPFLGLRHHVGRFDPKHGIGRVIVIDSTSEDAQENEYQDGEILLEIEPINYEVNGLKFDNKKRKDTRVLRELGSAVLRNDQSESVVKVDSVIAYDNLLSMYWGQGRGMLKGLPTNIRLPDNMEEIQWGIPYTEDRKDVFRIEAMLEPGSAVNVTLRGNQTESEVPYSGQLVAVYADLQTRARPVAGVLIDSSLKDLRAEYSPVYWLHNQSLVPTTTTVSTTVVTTTDPPTTVAPTDQDIPSSSDYAPSGAAAYVLIRSTLISAVFSELLLLV